VECRRENVTKEGNSRSVQSATVGVCDFFILRCSLRPEGSQERLQRRIAGVLRLRATSAVSPDPSVTHSAQDDDFVGGLNSASELIDPTALACSIASSAPR
jgi:hypothetical protein